MEEEMKCAYFESRICDESCKAWYKNDYGYYGCKRLEGECKK